MNISKLVPSGLCLLALTLSAPLATAAPRGGGSQSGHFGSMSRGGGGAWGGRGGNWHGGNWSGGNWRGGNGGNWRGSYCHGSIDGVLGPRTREAIRAYERQRGYAS